MERLPIININGLMAIKIPAGISEIEFINTNWYLRIGFVISLLSFVVWWGYKRNLWLSFFSQKKLVTSPLFYQKSIMSLF